jgi:NAD(P)-dependent dehydrogenase (short-subunit alcohol dehydrogenase family)
MVKRLAGKTALISGGGGGIARRTAQRFVEEGACVVLGDINVALAEEAARPLGRSGTAIAMDVREEADWQAAVGLAISRYGKLDIICNVAGFGIPGTIEDLKMTDYHAMMAVNLTGTIIGCKIGLQGILSSHGSGAIINISSLASIIGPADAAAYAATKGGVTSLTKTIAMHCAQKGYPVRCVAIHPTYVDTPNLDAIAAMVGSREALVNAMAKQVPMGRICTADDIASAILFVSSDEAGMISGSSIIIDGAQSAGPRSIGSV